MLVAGTQRTGHVRWMQAQNVYKRIVYRDKYIKFSYSSHFPFNILESPDYCPWDGTLVIRDSATGKSAGRAGVRRSELLPSGARIEWWTELGGLRFEVTSQIAIRDEFEERRHTIALPAGAEPGRFEAVEGSYALGLARESDLEPESGAGWQSIRSRASGYRIVTWNQADYDALEVSRSFDPSGRKNVNVISPFMAVNTLRKKLAAPRTELASLHYASPSPLDMTAIFSGR